MAKLFLLLLFEIDLKFVLWFGLVRFGSVWFGTVWFDLVRFSWVRLVWFGLVNIIQMILGAVNTVYLNFGKKQNGEHIYGAGAVQDGYL